MIATNAKPIDTARAQQLWREYVRLHDLQDQAGKVAAVDPETGRVWIGDTGIDVADQMQSDGFTDPVYLVRVGEDHFVRKGRR
jgi:hypothetical protein